MPLEPRQELELRRELKQGVSPRRELELRRQLAPAQRLGAEGVLPKEAAPLSLFGRAIRPAKERLLGTDVPRDPLATERAISEGGFAMAGAMAGSRLPIAPGPAGIAINPLTGALVGGGVAAAAGAVAPEATMEALEFLGLRPAGERERRGLSNEELKRVAGGAAQLDILAGGGLVGGQAVARLFGRAVGGVRKADREFAKRLSQDFGIDLDIARLTTSRIIRGFGPIVGAFPFMSSGYRRAARRIEQQTGEAINRYVGRFGPPTNITERGERIFAQAQELAAAVGQSFNKRYKDIRRLATSEGATFTPTTARGTAQQAIKEIDVQRPLFKQGAKGQVDPSLERTQQFLAEEIVPLAERQSYDQFDQVIRNLDAVLEGLEGASAKFARKQLFKVRASLLADLRSSPGASQGLRGMIRATDADFHVAMKGFETPTAQLIGRVKRKGLRGMVFQPHTTTPVDKLYGIVFDTKSARAMKELNILIGDKAFGELVAGHVDDMARQSFVAKKFLDGTERIIFDADKFKRLLGLDIANRPEASSLATAMKLRGQSIEDVKFFIEGLKKAWSVIALDPAQLVRRRVVLGGIRTGLRSIVVAAPAAGGPQGVLAGLGVLLSVRGFGGMLNNPAIVKSFRLAARADASALVRRGAALRFLRAADAVGDDPETRAYIKDARKAVSTWFALQLKRGRNFLGEL